MEYLHLLKWIIPSILVIRLAEVLRIRLLNLYLKDKYNCLLSELDILEAMRSSYTDNSAFLFLQDSLKRSIHEIEYTSLWFIIYTNKLYSQKIPFIEDELLILTHKQSLMKNIKQDKRLGKIHKEFTEASAAYLMDKSSIVFIVRRLLFCIQQCGKVSKYISELSWFRAIKIKTNNYIATFLPFQTLMYKLKWYFNDKLIYAYGSHRLGLYSLKGMNLRRLFLIFKK